MLRKRVEDDIINSIIANLQVGNIEQDDALQIMELTIELYEHIFAHYKELREQ